MALFREFPGEPFSGVAAAFRVGLAATGEVEVPFFFFCAEVFNFDLAGDFD